jgi:hypothetical protein
MNIKLDFLFKESSTVAHDEEKITIRLVDAYACIHGHQL